MRLPNNAVAASLLAALVALVTLTALLVPPPAKAVPRSFFGIVPQHVPDAEETAYMRAGRIGSIRWPMAWGAAEPFNDGRFIWDDFDSVVEAAARDRLEVLPFVYATPSWVARDYTRMPIDSGRARRAWVRFLTAAVERYGPRGSFWAEHSSGADFLPRVPIRNWQIWNEANFFYFATPASPSRYARLLKLSYRTVKRADPGAKVILSGLFGDPNPGPPKGMDAVDFLDRLYAVPGIKRYFDGAALHPYAETAGDLALMTEGMREVMLDNRDGGAALYMTEMGWGSQNNPNLVSFEQGVRFQIAEMTSAYEYLIQNRRRLNLKGTYWFTWKDMAKSCNFCDSTGLFRRGRALSAKPAWHAFVDITGGRPRP
jgi:polysaccharide biosynthesis protein PslG